MGGLLMTTPENSLLAERIEQVQSDIRKIESSMSAMASALQKLAIVEERQVSAGQALERAFADLSRQQQQIAEQANRIRALEQALATAGIENRSRNIWVDRAITGIVCLAGFLLAKSLGLIK